MCTDGENIEGNPLDTYLLLFIPKRRNEQPHKDKNHRITSCDWISLECIGVRIMSNERKLATREMELRLQLDAKAIKGL